MSASKTRVCSWPSLSKIEGVSPSRWQLFYAWFSVGLLITMLALCYALGGSNQMQHAALVGRDSDADFACLGLPLLSGPIAGASVFESG